MIACNLEISYRPLGKLKENIFLPMKKIAIIVIFIVSRWYYFSCYAYFLKLRPISLVIFIGEIIWGGSVPFKHIDYYD